MRLKPRYGTKCLDKSLLDDVIGIDAIPQGIRKPTRDVTRKSISVRSKELLEGDLVAAYSSFNPLNLAIICRHDAVPKSILGREAVQPSFTRLP